MLLSTSRSSKLLLASLLAVGFFLPATVTAQENSDKKAAQPAVKKVAPAAPAQAAPVKVTAKAAAPAVKKVAAKPAVAKKATPVKKAAKKTWTAPVKTVNLELVNADLVYVIKYLAKEMGRNVFVAPDVAGSVTVTLNKVRPEGALALILKMQASDYDYKLIDNTVVVASPEKLANIPANILSPKASAAKAARTNLTEQMFYLEAAPAASIIEFLKGQYPEAVFTPHPTVNGFLCKGTPSELKAIKGNLSELDKQEAPAPAPSREYIPVRYGEIENIQNLVKTLVPSVALSADKRLGLLIVDGTDADIEAVQEVLANLDKSLEQVMLDVKVVDLNEQGSKTVGVSWSDTSGSFGTFQTTFTEVLPSLYYEQGTKVKSEIAETGEISTDGSITAGKVGPLTIGSFGRTPFALQASLQFAISNSDAKLLASPRVATISGQEAQIHVGDKYPIVFYDSRAGQYQAQYVDIGTKINVTPQIKSDGYIVAKIEPTVSSLSGLIRDSFPITSERKISTTMRVKDGDTVVLGGLVQDYERHSVQKIPLLGDLPILGVLFRTNSDENSRSEVVVMMTPHIMK